MLNKKNVKSEFDLYEPMCIWLQKYLEDKFGMTVQTLDYWPDNAEAVWKMYYSGRNLRTIVRNILVFFDYSYRKKMKKRQSPNLLPIIFPSR